MQTFRPPPKFLKFRIPTNGCFDSNSVKEFQRKLLYKELLKAKSDQKHSSERVAEKRSALQAAVPAKWLPSIAFHTRLQRIELRKKQMKTHNKKLQNLSAEQEQTHHYMF